MAQLSPEDRFKMKQVFKDIDSLLTTIETCRASIKDHVSALSEEFDIPKKVLNKMTRVYHSQTFQVTQQENDEFETLYQTVVHTSSETK